jgi:hypothetical protein
MVLRYSYGVQLLSRADTIHIESEANADEYTPLLEDIPILSSPPSSSTLANDLAGYNEPDSPPIGPFELNASLLSSPNPNTVSRYESSWRRIARGAVIVNNFMTVPMWSALLSLLVACIEPLKHALLNHLHPLNTAIANAGKCAVPLTLVVLGAYFYVPDEPTHDDIYHKPQGNQIKAKPGETKTVILSVASRMIITPALLIPGMALATKYAWHEVFLDPVFVVVNVILVCSPAALTLAQITQGVSGDALERLLSRTIFWSYCIFTPPVMILSVVLALILAKL